MPRPTVALATCAEFPSLDDDDRLLLPALEAVGIDAVPVVWTDVDVEWAAFDAVVVRETWDYHQCRDDFLSWTRSVAATSRLHNAASLIAWNTDKHYLRDLAAAGVPVVPTEFWEPGDDPAGWLPPAEAADVVVKPAVSAGSTDTARYPVYDVAGVRAHLGRLLATGRSVMVQPYLTAVDDRGETALLFFGGEFSHAIRKGPLLQTGVDGERVAGLFLAEDITPRTPTAVELDVARRVLGAIPGSFAPLYARVDVVPGPDGAPLLLELELTEPSLFLAHAEGVADRLAAQIAATIRP